VGREPSGNFDFGKLFKIQFQQVRFNMDPFRKCSFILEKKFADFLFAALQENAMLNVGAERLQSYSGSCCHRAALQGPATMCITAFSVTVQEHFTA
jgi:hypothetical protein